MLKPSILKLSLTILQTDAVTARLHSHNYQIAPVCRFKNLSRISSFSVFPSRLPSFSAFSWGCGHLSDDLSSLFFLFCSFKSVVPVIRICGSLDPRPTFLRHEPRSEGGARCASTCVSFVCDYLSLIYLITDAYVYLAAVSIECFLSIIMLDNYTVSVTTERAGLRCQVPPSGSINRCSCPGQRSLVLHQNHPICFELSVADNVIVLDRHLHTSHSMQF